MKVMVSMLDKINQQFNLMCSKIPESVVTLIVRIAISGVFWRSVQTKIVGWELFDQSFKFFNLGANALTLFRYQYNVPVLTYTQAAYAATGAEFFFSIMLLLGFFTRVAALGLLGVTAVIQMFVYPEAWPTHILWLGGLLYLIKTGGGFIAIDKLITSNH